MRRLLLAATALLPLAAHAADVKMAVRTDASSIDPHYHVYTPNSAVFHHIFDTLVSSGPRGELRPGLATSWKTVADDIWEFKLRQGVTFHDGSAFTPEDVAFSIARAPNVPNSPSSYSQYTKLIEKTEIVDPQTIRIYTKGPAPTLPIDMTQIAIVSKRVVEGKTTTDFNSGIAAIGTGPYRFIEWVSADHLTLAKNPTYLGRRRTLGPCDPPRHSGRCRPRCRTAGGRCGYYRGRTRRRSRESRGPA